MSRKKLIYLIVLGLSGIAFMVDRLFLGEPETVSAATSLAAEHSLTNKRTPQPATEAKPALASDPTLAWLERLAEPNHVRDVFALTPRFSARMRTLAELVEPPPDTPPEENPATTFIQSHQLQTTLTGPDGSMAVINGEVLRLGDRIANFRLVHVDAFEAHFRDDRRATKVSLVMELPFQSTTALAPSGDKSP